MSCFGQPNTKETSQKTCFWTTTYLLTAANEHSKSRMQLMPEVYLRRDVQMEPLFDRWYAWSYLIPPATAARNITERHLKIINSYIAAPQVHANAAKNPKLLGGPFIDYGGKRVDEIRELRAQTMQKRARLLELSAAIAELDDMLRKK